MSELVELAKRVLRDQAGLQQASNKDVQTHNSQAREELDRYFAQVILPKLTALHVARRLPNLAQDPLWAELELEWNKAAASSPAACNVDLVKTLMTQFIGKIKQNSEEKGGEQHG